MEIQVAGILKNATNDQPSFTGWRIEAIFDRTPADSSASTIASVAGRARPESAVPTSFNESDLNLTRERVGKAIVEPAPAAVPIPFRVSALSDASGNFTLVFPAREEIASQKVKVVVSSPTGRTIDQVDLIAAELGPPITITVREFAPPTTIDKPIAPPAEVTRRILGRLVERTGKQLSAGLQVLLLGHQQEPPDGDSLLPILVAKADSSGYFSGRIKNVKFDRVVAVVEGIPGDIPVRLVDSLVPPRIPIVVELPNTSDGPSLKDCGCSNSTVPRTPTQDDIAETPGAFSADLGTGQCIRFNVPNRAIEEFNFYSVVRTTEPDIVGITVGTLRDRPITVPRARPVFPPAGRAISAATIEAAIRSALLLIPSVRSSFGTLTDSITWERLESPIRKAVIDAGGTPLSTTFFLQFPGWGTGDVWGFGGVDSFNDGQRKLQSVIRQAASAGATTDATSSTSGTSIVPAPGVPQFEIAELSRIHDFSVVRAESLYDRLGTKRPPARARLDGNSPVDWDYTPTFYQAASIAHGHLLHFKQVWYADGYSLGDLLYSLPLAPGQKKLISVVDWERREQTTREEFTSAEEGLQAALSRDRDLSEVVSGALSESSRGGSRNTTVGVGAGKGSAGNGSYQQFNFGGVMGVSGGFGASDSNAFQISSRDLSSSSLQTLRDRTLQSASAVRNLRSTIVQTARQGEAVRATTEVVANHNHCHALTIQYFEVLRHLKVTHELTDVEECLFVPFPMTEFDRPKVLRWRESLSIYLKRPELAPAFDSARRIETEWSEEYTPVARYADELVIAIFGELTLTILIPLPPFPEKPKPKPEETAEEAEAAVRKALAPTEGPLGTILAVATLGASFVVGTTVNAVSDAAKATAQGARAMAESLLNEPSAEERYARFQQEVMPAAAAGFVDQLELFALVGASEVQLNGADFTLVSDYRPGTPLLVSVRGRITTPITRASIAALVIKSSVPLPPGCRAIVNSANLQYQTDKLRHDMINDRRINDDIDLPIVASTGIQTPSVPAALLPPGFPTDWIPIPGVIPIRGGNGAMLYTPLDEWEQKSTRLEDIRLSAELIEHLNANLEYYHHAIWWTMDPNRRYMLLDGYHAPNADGRSVASVVDNTLIGIIGNSLILPVAAGNRLDPEFKLATGVTLLEHYDPQSPAPPARVSLPTRGVFAEAVMGDCNACEKIDDTRFWRWEESPIDEPPSIDVAALASRRSEPNFGTPTAFPSPLVSIQNAPQAPDPNGLGAALETLTKQSFSDMTGLPGTQANAAAAFSKAMDTALAFGKEASALAQQAAMVKSKDKVLDTIDKAKQDGKISDEDETKHTNNVLDRLTMTPQPPANATVEPSESEPRPDEKKPVPLPKQGAKPKKENIIPVSIKLRVFVPSQIWEPFVGSPIRFNGDARTFHPSDRTSRAEREVSFRLNADTFNVTEVNRGDAVYGVAEIYLPTSSHDVAGKPPWWKDKDNAGVTPLTQKRMSSDSGVLDVDVDADQNRIVVTFTLNGQPYFPWDEVPSWLGSENAQKVAAFMADFANPDFDARIIVTVMNWKDGSPRYIVSGSHNKFPAYEVYVNGETAYRSDETKLEQVLDVTAALNADIAAAVGQFSVLRKPGE